MDYNAILQKRRTIRFYQQKKVAEKHLVKMVEAALHAPSAANNQILRYTIVRNEDLVQAVFYHTRYGGRVTPKRSPQWGVNAPTAFIAISAVKSGETVSPMAYADSGAAIMSMQFAAVAENLGTCWIGAFNAKEVSNFLAIPENEQLIFLLAVGHPAEKPVEDVIQSNESVAYYLDEYDNLHVPKYALEAVTRIL
ncbi:MAG: nitroreductase family protein [Lentisphaerae bacterium]|nr:nitroreductase family protein [Lentisphaerota bacterium]